MKSTVKERINCFIKTIGVSRSEFCRIIGVSETYIGSMRESIQPDKLKSIAVNYPMLNIGWLMTGIGSMLNQNPDVSIQNNSENLSISDLVRALDNISESVKLNAIANERNSRNMEKMLEMLSEKDNSQKGEFVRPKRSNRDAAHTA